MATIARLVAVFEADSVRFQRDVLQNQKMVGNFERQVETSSRGIGQSFDRIGTSLQRLTLASGLAFGGMVAGAKNFVQTAFQAQTGAMLFDRLAQQSGQSLSQVHQQINQLANDLKLPVAVLEQNSSELLRNGYNMQQISGIYRGAAASGLLLGKSTSESIGVVTDALVSQMSQYLNYIGIAQNLSTYQQKFAHSIGKTVPELTQAEQAQAAYNLVMFATKQDVTAMPALMDGYGGSVARFGRSIYNLKVGIGTLLEPAVTHITDSLGMLVDRFNAMSGPDKRFVVQLGEIAAGAVGVLAALGLLVKTFELVATVGALLGGVLGIIFSPVVLGIMAVIAAVGLFKTAWDADWGAIRTTAENAWASLQPKIDAITKWGNAALSTTWKWVVTAAGDAWSWITGMALPWLKGNATTAWSWSVSAAGEAWSWITGDLLPWLDATIPTVWNWTVTAAGSAWAWVTGTFLPWIDGIAQTTWTWSVTTGGAIWDWITGNAIPWINATVSTAWSWTVNATGAAYGWLKDTAWPWLSKAASTTWNWIARTAKGDWSWLKGTAWPWLSQKASTAWDWTASLAGNDWAWLKDTAWPWLTKSAETVWSWTVTGLSSIADTIKSNGLTKTVDVYAQIAWHWLGDEAAYVKRSLHDWLVGSYNHLAESYMGGALAAAAMDVGNLVATAKAAVALAWNWLSDVGANAYDWILQHSDLNKNGAVDIGDLTLMAWSALKLAWKWAEDAIDSLWNWLHSSNGLPDQKSIGATLQAAWNGKVGNLLHVALGIAWAVSIAQSLASKVLSMSGVTSGTGGKMLLNVGKVFLAGTLTWDALSPTVKSDLIKDVQAISPIKVSDMVATTIVQATIGTLEWLAAGVVTTFGEALAAKMVELGLWTRAAGLLQYVGQGLPSLAATGLTMALTIGLVDLFFEPAVTKQINDRLSARWEDIKSTWANKDLSITFKIGHIALDFFKLPTDLMQGIDAGILDLIHAPDWLKKWLTAPSSQEIQSLESKNKAAHSSLGSSIIAQAQAAGVNQNTALGMAFAESGVKDLNTGNGALGPFQVTQVAMDALKQANIAEDLSTQAGRIKAGLDYIKLVTDKYGDVIAAAQKRLGITYQEALSEAFYGIGYLSNLQSLGKFDINRLHNFDLGGGYTPSSAVSAGVLHSYDGRILPGTGGPDQYLSMVAPGEAIVPSNAVRGGWSAVLRWFRRMGVPGFASGKGPNLSGINVAGVNLGDASQWIHGIGSVVQQIGGVLLTGIKTMVDFLGTIVEAMGKALLGDKAFADFKKEIEGGKTAVAKFIDELLHPHAQGGTADRSGIGNGLYGGLHTGAEGRAPSLWDRARMVISNGAHKFVQWLDIAGQASSFFGKILGQINPVASFFGDLLSAIGPYLRAFMEPLAIVAGIIAQALEPVLESLFPIIKFFGQVLLWAAKIGGAIWNAFANAVNFVLGWLHIHLGTIDLSTFDRGMQKLNGLTWDTAKKMAGLGNAATTVTEAIKNLPSILKIQQVRMQAAHTISPGSELAQLADAAGIPHAATGAFVPATPGGMLVRVADGGEGEYIVPQSRVGVDSSGGVLHIHVQGNVYGVNDMKRIVFDAIDEYGKRTGRRLFGTATPATGGAR